MVMREATIQVRHIRYAGRIWIFLGDCLDAEGNHTGEALVVVCSSNLLGEQQVIHKGDIWAIRGNIEKYKGQDQLRSTEAFLSRPYGKNFVNALAYNPRFQGIGPQTAKRLWVRFGEEIYRILNQSDREELGEILKPEQISSLLETWHELNLGEVLRWLDAHHFSVKLGKKIFDYYGPNAISKLRSDPYRMISFESSWPQVDRIAKESFGITNDDPRRLHAAVAESLYVRFDNKHTACLGKELLGDVTRLVGSDVLARDALNHCYADGAFIRYGEIFQARGPWLMETSVYEFLIRRLNKLNEGKHVSALDPIHPGLLESSIARFEAEEYTLGDEQKQAVRLALRSPVTVITGGAGVGKTSVLKCLFKCIDALGGSVIQMALSGRAARRMSEATGRDAYTIAGFLTNIKRVDLEKVTTVVIDEASMLDLIYAYKIFQRLPEKCNLVLVGDTAQLPPIGPGLLLPLLAESEFVPTVCLTRVYRQDTSSGIPAISHSVRNGQWPDIPVYSGKGVGVSIMPSYGQGLAQDIASIYEELGGPNPGEDIQILCATKSYKPSGTAGLNLLLHSRYTANQPALKVCDDSGREIDTGFSEGDPIMYTKNDWGRELFNGTLGRIDQVFCEPQGSAIARCAFDTGEQTITKEDIESLAHSYAITIHKSQGSQFKRVIVVLSASRILDRTLIYTAITRGVEQVVMIGDIKATSKAVVNMPVASTRRTGLRQMLGLSGGNGLEK